MTRRNRPAYWPRMYAFGEFFPRLRGKYPEGGMGAGVMRDQQKTRFARRLRKAMTEAEILLWSRLRRDALGYRFHRQLPVGPFIVDFGCLECRLIVEVDGATHSSDEERAYDARRTRYLEQEGWRVVRVWNDEVFRNLGGVLEAISRAAWEHETARKYRQSS